MGHRPFKSSYKDSQGERQPTKKWCIAFRDHNDTIRRLPAFTSKDPSNELGRSLVKLVAYH